MNTKHICECPNCAWRGTEDDMKRVYPDIPDLAARMAPGEPVPIGECPECGALCHPIDPPAVNFTLHLRNTISRMAGLLAEAAGLADETAQWLTGGEGYEPQVLADALTKLAMDCREASNKVQSLKIVVEVRGGCAKVTTCPTGVEVEIVDHDNEKVGR